MFIFFFFPKESTVLVELSGVIDCDFLSTQETKSHTKALGLDTPNPIVQIGSHIFSGQYEANIGTSIILEEIVEDGKTQLKYLCHTDKKLMLKRAFLQNKDKPVTIDADDLDDSSREATDSFQGHCESMGIDNN